MTADVLGTGTLCYAPTAIAEVEEVFLWGPGRMNSLGWEELVLLCSCCGGLRATDEGSLAEEKGTEQRHFHTNISLFF